MEKYLEVFLTELENQTIFDDLEVFLDLNSPSKNEIQIAENYALKYRGKLILNIVEKVDPIGRSMNRCIQETSGELLAIWNADDLRTDDSLSAQYKILQAHPEVSIAFGPYRIVNKFQKTHGIMIDHAKVDDLTFSRGMFAGPFFMFRRSDVDRIGYFDENLKSGADFDFALRLLTVGKSKSTSELLGYYLNEGLGASTRPNSLQPIERTVIQMRYGLYDSIDYSLIPFTNTYSIPNLKFNGKLYNIQELLPEYHDLYSRNIEFSFRKFSLRKLWTKVLSSKIYKTSTILLRRA
jgi:glycosyltransferase involved in cell wall biosynthesis